MNVKYKKAILIFVVFFLLDLRLFYLVPLPYILSGSGADKVLLSIYSVFLFGFFAFRKKLYCGEYARCLLFIFAVVLLNSISTYVKFDYRITQIIWPAIPFSLLLFYYVFMKILSQRNNLHYFLKIGEICWTILCILFLIQRRLYLRDHTIFMQLNILLPDYYLEHAELGFRIYSVFDGFLRAFIPCLGFICIKNQFRRCKSELITLIFSILAVVLIDRSRIYLIIIIISLLIEFIYSSKDFIKVENKKLMVTAIAISLVALIILIGSISSSFSDNTGSVYARIGAINYYFELLKSNFLFGIGMVSPDAGSTMYYFVHGPKGYFHFDDIGVIGTFAKLGFLSLVWYVYMIMKSVQLVVKTNGKNKILSVGLIATLILSSFTQSYLDPQRLVSLLFTLMFIELNFAHPDIQY